MSTVETPVGARAARRSSRRPQLQHLITADERSLAELEALLVTLPLCAVGRVFVEVPDVDDIGVVTAPPRMTVTWLPRARRGGVRHAAGELLARAATAWADEMLCDESEGALRTEATLLGGYLGTADIAEHLMECCGIAPSAVHAPAAYGLNVL
ncbi:SIP domain-containing protein [Microbacterium sp.]|uniref:SIP domain-containing protein n=1 Tax=Microbacterium sp. TaxID=51671 RepID=UPI00261C249A|nr:SIP domain-containing protein [uncultured Microbacterium sp.]